jgi:acetyltransferase-like isoleucine patch superfamily enzyme
MPEGLTQTVREDSTVDVAAQRTMLECKLRITGPNARVVLGAGGTFRQCNFVIEAPDSTLEIGEGVTFTGSIFLKGKAPNKVVIGPGTTCGNVTIICGEGSTVEIGADCMLAWAVEIRTTDSHAIFDIATGERINAADNIRLGDHVWVAAKTTLLKSTRVAEGSVVGMGAFLNKDFPEPNSLIVGNPARVVRSGIRWERPLLG